MHVVSAASIPMDRRLPTLRTYLASARRTVKDPTVPQHEKERLAARIARIEQEIANAASK